MKQLFTLLCCLIGFSGFCQSINTAYSDPFDEPDALDMKVVQCPNGNTFLFSFTKKDGIDVAVYDKARKRIATQNLSGGANSWDPSNMVGTMFSGVSKGSKIAAIYPMGDEIVIFMEQVAEREPSLYRIRLSSTDGKLIKEEQIAQMPAYAKGSGYAMVFAHIKAKGFYVERDMATGAYAVLAFDGFAPETAKRIELVHYDANHQEISRSYFDAPETRFKFINYLGMVVNGTTGVYLMTYCYGGAGTKIFLSELRDKALTHHALDFTANLKETKGTLVYNPVTKHLQLFTLSESSAESSGLRGVKYIMRVMFVTIDPANYTVLSNKVPSSQMITKDRKLKYDKEEERYTGVPMNVVINPDGTTTIVYEDQRPLVGSSRGGLVDNLVAQEIAKNNNVFINSDVSNVTSNRLLDIGITDLDELGTEKAGYVVRKAQTVKVVIPPLSHADMRNNRVTFDVKKGFGADANTGFYSFDYISTPSGRYAIFNDHPKNFERDAEKNPKVLQGVSDANTICYRLTGGQMSKMYFFGEPNDSFDNRLALITSGDYSEVTGDYAVLMIEKNGRKKAARIAWAHLK